MRQHRFVALDGLRGIAALAIVLYHGGTALGLTALATRAYLAVDFFFVLSGFVIAHAYQEKLVAGAMSPRDFLRVRIVRLWPLAALGGAIGAVASVVAPRAMGNGASASPAFGLLVASALLLVPNVGSSVSGAYPLNPPIWSVAYELAANYVYGLFARRLTSRRLAAIALVGGVALVVATVADNGANNLNPARVVYSFAVGVLLYRAFARGTRAPIVRPSVLAFALVAALFLPDVPGVSHGVLDAALIVLVFPAIVWIGASCAGTGRTGRVSALSGEASYPLYAVHYPIIVGCLGAISPTASRAVILPALVGLTALATISSIIIARVYDAPIRSALTRVSLRARVAIGT